MSFVSLLWELGNKNVLCLDDDTQNERDANASPAHDVTSTQTRSNVYVCI